MDAEDKKARAGVNLSIVGWQLNGRLQCGTRHVAARLGKICLFSGCIMCRPYSG